MCCIICRRAEDGHCLFGGWARMAQPIAAFNVVEVGLFLSEIIKLEQCLAM